MHWDKIIIFLILESVMGNHNMDIFARIINGQNAAHGQFPYQVFSMGSFINNVHSCGGGGLAK